MRVHESSCLRWSARFLAELCVFRTRCLKTAALLNCHCVFLTCLLLLWTYRMLLETDA